MKKKDTPQDEMLFDGKRAACYAVEDDGTYTLVKTTGWETVNVVNIQAWEFISQKVSEVMEEIRKGKKSLLAFHMERYQMNVTLLSKYVNLPKWKVRRHLNPKVFARLKPDILERYAWVFQISTDDLLTLPESSDAVFSKPKTGENDNSF